MKILSEFCSEQRLNEEIVKKEYGDLIIETGGQLFIDEEKFDVELTKRGKRIGRKKPVRVASVKRSTPGKVMRSKNPGVLVNAISKKQGQVAKLETQISQVKEKLEKTSDPNKKASLAIQLRSREDKLSEAKDRLQQIEARLQDLAFGTASS